MFRIVTIAALGFAALPAAAHTLRAPGLTLPLVGPAVVGSLAPVDPVPLASTPGALYNASTGHSIAGDFAAFYQSVSVPTDILGAPRTEAFREASGTLTQYFDRAVLQERQGKVIPLPLGQQATAARHFAPVAAVPETADVRYFTATGHTLSGVFLSYWLTHQGALVFGSPISQPLVEGNGDGSGRRYTVQWFENARLEYHADLRGTRYQVQVGLLGAQALLTQPWFTSSPDAGD